MFMASTDASAAFSRIGSPACARVPRPRRRARRIAPGLAGRTVLSDFSEELLEIDGLGQIGVRFDVGHPFLPRSRHDDHGDGRERGIPYLLRSKLPAVHHR